MASRSSFAPAKTLFVSLCLVVIGVAGFCARAQVAERKPQAPADAVKTTICELISQPESFDGKVVELRADVLAGLETNVLYDLNCERRKDALPRILFVEEEKVDRTKEYMKFWKLVSTYSEPEGKRHSIVPDKYTVRATVTARFDAPAPSRAGARVHGQMVLISVRDVVARPFDGSFLERKK